MDLCLVMLEILVYDMVNGLSLLNRLVVVVYMFILCVVMSVLWWWGLLWICLIIVWYCVGLVFIGRLWLMRVWVGRLRMLVYSGKIFMIDEEVVVILMKFM